MGTAPWQFTQASEAYSSAPNATSSSQVTLGVPEDEELELLLEELELLLDELEELLDELAIPELLLDELEPDELLLDDTPPDEPPPPPQALIAADNNVTQPSCTPRVAILFNSRFNIYFSQCERHHFMIFSCYSAATVSAG